MPNRSMRPAWRPWLHRLLVFSCAVALGLLAGCATKPLTFPAPLRQPTPVTGNNDVIEGAETPTRKRPLVEAGPGVAATPAPNRAAAPSPENAPIPAMPRKRPVSLVFDSVPIESFIRAVFGVELGFPVQIDPALSARQDLLSLSLRTPERPAQVYAIARKVLLAYGVEITELGGVLQFHPVKLAGGSGLPALVATRSLPDVPAGQRTAFVAMPLEVSRPGAIAAQVRTLFGKNQVTFTEMPEQNALLISGPGDDVRAAMEAVKVLDSGGLIGKRSLRINPLYVPVDTLAKELASVLAGQGVAVKSAANGGVVSFVPVDSANALLVFSDSEPAMKLVEEWAAKLDQPSQDTASDGLYMYSARYTTVETLLPVLQALMGNGSPSAGQAQSGASTNGAPGSRTAGMAGMDSAGMNGVGADSAGTGAAGAGMGGARQRGGNTATVITGQGMRVAVDPARNVIIFQGEPQRWRALRGILARLDQPARQVVIEVTVAEVTLTNDFSNGVEWALRNIHVGGMSGPLTALQGTTTSMGTSGLVWQGMSSSGQVKALVNLFAKDSRVTVLATPRILVKSGDAASIDVGTEVPIITSQATMPGLPTNEGTSSILQSVQYRKTGVLLGIDAIVHSSQRVDLKVSLEVSQAQATDTSNISSPSVFSRKLATSLSLADGESTLLGGLISDNQSDGKSKVPFLGDVPVLGKLFQSRTKTDSRTELLMLITPYVVENAAQTQAITDAIRSRFSDDVNAKPSGP